MDGLLPPTPFYALLAIATGVVSKITADGVRASMFSHIRLWKLWLLHSPVLAVWAHVIVYMFFQLVDVDLQLELFQRINLFIHAVLLLFVSGVSGWMYFRQITMLCSDLKGP